ncbi:MAG: hypothetical protein ACI8RD_010307 [Bacillariaceae sp.]|jgi:hypothetical protein
MEGKYEKKAQNGGGDYDEAFLRRFAAEIGTALREREDDKDKQSSSNNTSIEDSVEDLYRSLVFDEPSIYHILNLPVVASALARQLLLSSSSSSSSSYALSNRLLNGIIYLCNQNTTTVVTKPENENETKKHNDTTVGHSTIKTAMAKLAFCILIDIPLECCRDENSSSESNMNKIRNLLGSYKGSSMNDKNKNKEGNTNTKSTSSIIDDDDAAHSNNVHNEDKMRSMSNFMENNDDDINSSSSDNKEDNNSAGEEIQQQKQQSIEEDEVWAIESDPSDYDFGDDTPAADDITIQEENDWLDPKILSQPDPNLTLQQTRDAIGTLLQIASYTLLEPIFYLPQKDTSRYVSQLTQLVLTLLKPRRKDISTPSSLPGSSSLLDSSVDYAILYPLWILRDAAAYHTNSTTSTTTRQSCTTNYQQEYLEILQTLLAIDQAYLQDVGSSATSIKSTSDPDFDLCVASIVGLSALSAWCSMQKKSTQSTVDDIVDSMNDLSHVVERAEQTYKKNLPNTLIPILEILSGIYYDHVDNNILSTSSSVPQTLLNSGFLRQILALVTLDEASTGDLLGFHHALWGLCQSFPKIVGKYVFRYPGSSQIVRSYATDLSSSSPQNCVQSILWNIYGWYQCKQASLTSGGVNIVLKKIGSSTSDGKKSLNTSRLIEDECSEVCSKAWSQLCKLVIQAIESSSNGIGSDDAGAEKVIQEWGRLLVLSRISSIATHFKSLIDPSLLDDISIVISNQSKQILIDKTADESESREDSKANDKKDDDKEKEEDKERRKPSRRQKIISQAHKVLKEYKLFFLGTVVGTSKTD